MPTASTWTRLASETIEAEHPELTVDSGSAPSSDSPDAIRRTSPRTFARHGRSTRLPPSRLPSPETSEALSMPADNCLRLDDHQDLPPTRPQPRQDLTQKRRSAIRSDGLDPFRSRRRQAAVAGQGSGRCNATRGLRKDSGTMARTIRMVVHMSETLSGTSREY